MNCVFLCFILCFHVIQSQISSFNIFETNAFYITFTAILMKRCSTSLVWNCYDFIMKQGFMIQRIFIIVRHFWDQDPAFNFYSQHKCPHSTFSRPGFTLYFHYNLDEYTLCPPSLKVLRSCFNISYDIFFELRRFCCWKQCWNYMNLTKLILTLIASRSTNVWLMNCVFCVCFILCFDVISHKSPRSTFSRPGRTLYFYYDFEENTLCPLSLKVLRYCFKLSYDRARIGYY